MLLRNASQLPAKSVAEYPVDFLAPRRHHLLDGFPDLSFPRLTGEHPRHRLFRTEKRFGEGIPGHVRQRHIGVVAGHLLQHVLVEGVFGITHTNLAQQDFTHCAGQFRWRRCFPLRVFRQVRRPEGQQ